jgi:hypothetical protein
VLRVTPSFGRPFLAEEDGATRAHPVVVVSEGPWRRRFAADPPIGAIGLVLGEGLRLTASDPRVPATGAAVDPIIVLRDS